MYQAILHVYPARFRQEYEHELMLVFRNQCRDGVVHDRSYWMGLLTDVLRSAPREWREEITTNMQSREIHMKGFAFVAVLVSVFELFNTALEMHAGGFAARDVLAQAGIAAAILSMAALLVSGIRLLRSGRMAAPFARISAASCIASFAFVGLMRPAFSVLAMLLGIGFPLILIIWLVLNRDGDGSLGPVRNVA